MGTAHVLDAVGGDGRARGTGPPASTNRCHGSVGLEGQAAAVDVRGQGRAIWAQFGLVRLYARMHFARPAGACHGVSRSFVCNLSRLKKVPINPSTGSLCLFDIGKHVFFSVFYYQVLQPFLGVAGMAGAHDPWLSIEHRHIFEGTVVPLRTTPLMACSTLWERAFRSRGAVLRAEAWALARSKDPRHLTFRHSCGRLDLGLACVLMHRAASHQATGDLGGLMARPRRRGMGSEVARGGDEDRRSLWVALPGEVLPHGGLQVLHHVEAGVLAQDRVAQERNEIGGRMAGGEVGAASRAASATCCWRSQASRKARRSSAGARVAGSSPRGRRAGRDVEVAIEIDRERAMERGAQAQDLGLDISPATRSPA